MEANACPMTQPVETFRLSGEVAQASPPPPPAHDFYSPLSGPDGDIRTAADGESIYAPSESNYAFSSYAPSSYAPSVMSASASSSSKKFGRGCLFKTEEEYMAALREWAEEKKFVKIGDGDTQLKGFYGERTMSEYAKRPPKNKNQEKRRSGQRKPENIAVQTIPEEHEHEHLTEGTGEEPDAPIQSAPTTPQSTRRKSSLGNWLRKVRTSERQSKGKDKVTEDDDDVWDP